MIPFRSKISSQSGFLFQTYFRLGICALLMLFALTASAQSGRRAVTGSPSVPAPTPAAAAKPEKKPEDDKRQGIIVTSNRADAFAGVPLYLYDTVLRSCAGRLDDAHGVKVDVVTKYTSRSDAINTAKAQKEAYVVWLQLRTDSMVNSTPGYDLSDITVEYTVYEPTTAKVKASGTCYQGAARAGGVVVGPRTGGGTNPALVESRLRDSARDAADRILRALHIVLPTDLPPH